jgi:hypothetical protein
MHAKQGLAVTLTAILSVFGCKTAAELTIRDSEQRVFRARCSTEVTCSLEQTEGPKWPHEAPALALRSSGRITGVCNGAETTRVDSDMDCRALVCNTDADCPPPPRLDHGTCLGGLCTDVRHQMDVGDAVMLCLFGTGLGHDAPSQIERFALAHQCGNPCEIPATCKQP